MRAIFRWGQVLFIFMLLAAWGLMAIAQDKSKKPQPGRVEVQASPLQDQLKRGWLKARDNRDAQIIRKAVITPGTRDEYENVNVLFLFGNGDLGLFSGGDEVANDSWIYITKEQRDDFKDLLDSRFK